MKLSDALKSNISYDEKVQLACAQLPATFLQHWAIDCAESVLHIYEQEHPNDATVRNCIDVANQVLQGKLDKSVAYSVADAANSAANVAYCVALSGSCSSVISAARSAYSAASAAFATYYVASVFYSADRSAVYSAHAAKNKQQQEQLNIELLLKQVEVFESPLYYIMQES